MSRLSGSALQLFLCVLAGVLGGALLSTRAAPPDPAPKYEYTLKWIPTAIHPDKELNAYGAQGWELTSVGEAQLLPLDPKDPSSGVETRLMVFKRRL